MPSTARQQLHTRRRPTLLRALRGGFYLIILLALAAASTAGLFYAQDYWRLELLVHFRWAYFAIGLVLCALLAVGKHFFLLIPALALFAFNTSLLFHRATPLPEPLPTTTHATAHSATGSTAQAPQSYRALSINVYSRNNEITRVLDYLHSQSADIVALIEVTGPWITHLDALRTQYPYQARQIWGQNFGSVLLSRYPLSEVPRQYGYSGVGSIARIAQLPDGPCLILLVHPIAPITKRAWEWNANTLNDIARYINAAPADMPVLVLGDMNTTPWSTRFKTFTAQAGVRPPDTKGIWWATWRQPFWPAALPIDHFFINRHLQDTNTWVGPDVGSDHYPIGLDFHRR